MRWSSNDSPKLLAKQNTAICAECVCFFAFSMCLISIIPFWRFPHQFGNTEVHIVFTSTPSSLSRNGFVFWSTWLFIFFFSLLLFVYLPAILCKWIFYELTRSFSSESHQPTLSNGIHTKRVCVWVAEENAAQKPIILPLVENYAKTMATISHRFTWASCGQCE